MITYQASPIEKERGYGFSDFKGTLREIGTREKRKSEENDLIGFFLFFLDWVRPMGWEKTLGYPLGAGSCPLKKTRNWTNNCC